MKMLLTADFITKITGISLICIIKYYGDKVRFRGNLNYQSRGACKFYEIEYTDLEKLNKMHNESKRSINKIELKDLSWFFQPNDQILFYDGNDIYKINNSGNIIWDVDDVLWNVINEHNLLIDAKFNNETRTFNPFKENIIRLSKVTGIRLIPESHYHSNEYISEKTEKKWSNRITDKITMKEIINDKVEKDEEKNITPDQMSEEEFMKWRDNWRKSIDERQKEENNNTIVEENTDVENTSVYQKEDDIDDNNFDVFKKLIKSGFTSGTQIIEVDNKQVEITFRLL